MAFPLSNVTLAPDEYRRHTEGDVLRSLVDALIAEDLFGFRSRGRIGSVAGALYLPLTGDERHVQVGLGPDAVVFRATPAVALQPYRLSRPPVLLLGADGGGPVPLSPRELLDLVVTRLAAVIPGDNADPPGRAPNIDEVLDGLDLAVIHGAVLLEGDGLWGRIRSGARQTPLDWEALTAVGDRPFHPTGRARHGWDRARYRRYSPAGDGPVALDWVAVRADHLASGSVERLAEVLALARVASLAERERSESAPLRDRPPSPADALLSADERAALESAVAETGVDGPDHVVLPVHPWQRAHVLPQVFADEWRSGVCVPVATGLGAFWPTSSTRTLVPAGGASPAPVHVKLPVGITTLGALRLLPPRYLANAARAQRLLEQAADRHPALQGRLSVCDEQAWWAFAVPGGAGAHDDKPGHLGCLLRVWPDPGTKDSGGAGPSRSLVPLGALGVVLPDGSAPGLTRLITDRGDDPAAPAAALDVFDDVASVVSEVALACFGLGFMPELHGQNAVLACEGGRVAGIVLRDHDTVRLHRPWLAEAGLADPGYDVKPDSPNSLWATGPEELLGWFQTLAVEVALQAIVRALVSAYGVDEETVWRRLADVVRAARSGVDLPPAAAEIIDRQLFHAATWPTKLVIGPLLARLGTGGGSMPSGVGRAGNPFLAGDDRAAELAEHAAAERLVNCFLRESATEPVLVGSTVTIPFVRTRRAVIGSLAYRSPMGHHRFRHGFTLRTGEPMDATALAELVTAELGAGMPAAAHDAFAALTGESAAKTQHFLERLPVTGTVDPWHAPNPFLAAEQSVRLGHPFHPAPKASVGFTTADLDRYAPEVGASFPLHWLAVDPELVAEDRLDTVRSLDPPPAVCDAAGALLGARSSTSGAGRATWPLLPCHPWQAEHLAALPAAAGLFAAGRLVALGPLGFDVHPTASVRTVWDPASGRQLKLALSVRITNFVRENNPEQLRRSVDASRALAALGSLDASVDSPVGSFGVLLELGSRRVIAPEGTPAADAAALEAATGVVYREGPPLAGSASPMAVAALLEPDPIDGVPPIIRAVQQAAGRGETGRAWFERYLTLTLRPLTRLLLRHGIALEAHSQNSLLALGDGWPVRFLVRDLEGVSLNRAHPAVGERFASLMSAGSPVLYEEPEVWRRFAYFVLVNHFGQLIATLAEHLGPSEAELWALAGALMAEEAVRHGSAVASGDTPAPPGAAVPLRELLDGAELPAKANLVSVLEGHGEHPTWIAVPSPLRTRRRT